MKWYVAVITGLLLALGICGAEDSDDMHWTTYEDEYISFEYPAALFELYTRESPEYYSFMDKETNNFPFQITLGLSSVEYYIRLDDPEDDVTPYTRIIESVEIKI